MELYTKADIELVNDKLPDMIKTLDKMKADIYEPTKKETLEATKVVLDYVREHKRKIYGGTAQNQAIIMKNPADALYDEDHMPDIDIYTPDPINDMVKVCDLLHAKGFKSVVGMDAIHEETYKVFVNEANVLDLSYVPQIIYHNIPFFEHDKLIYVDPSFAYIDLYKMLTDPHFSASFRWKDKKIFERIARIQTYYPFNKATAPLNDSYDVPKNLTNDITKINSIIYDYIRDSKSCIMIGQYAYNYLLEESGILNSPDRKQKSKYKLINTPFMQIVTTSYFSDAVNIYLTLKQKMDTAKLSYKEYYPMWTFTGYNAVFYYDNFPILHITPHHKRCTPIREVPYRTYLNGISTTNPKHKVIIGSFDFVLLMNMISLFRVKVNKQKEKYHYHNIMMSHLVEMRNYYLNKNKSTLLDDTIFKSFIIECIGEGIDPNREARQRRTEKYKKGKLVTFRYNPEEKKAPPDFKFHNTSGNIIQKEKNYKLKKYIDAGNML